MKNHQRLWSLWDMYSIDAPSYQTAMTILSQVIARTKHGDGTFQSSAMGEQNASATRDMLSRVALALEPLAVPVTKATIRDSLLEIGPKTQFIGCGQLLLGVQGTLGRELESAKLFALDASRVGFYEPTEPLFGKVVDSQFPGIAGEIQDGGRAYACDLTTAAAFHWIRCLEAGTRAMARCLAIPDPTRGKDRNWSELKRAINGAIDAKWPASTGRMSGDAKLFDELIGSIGAMTNPYRNATMHLDANYSTGEALHIFELVKGLMQKIASRMNEDGLPLA